MQHYRIYKTKNMCHIWKWKKQDQTFRKVLESLYTSSYGLLSSGCCSSSSSLYRINIKLISKCTVCELICFFFIIHYAYLMLFHNFFDIIALCLCFSFWRQDWTVKWSPVRLKVKVFKDHLTHTNSITTHLELKLFWWRKTGALQHCSGEKIKIMDQLGSVW